MISRISDIISAFHTISPLIWCYISLWYQELLITVPYNIIFFWCPMISPFSVGEPLATGRSSTSSGLSTANELGSRRDGFSAELRLTGSSTWTCWSGCRVGWHLPFKLPLLQAQFEAPHWQWACSLSLTGTTQVAHLVLAPCSQVHSQSVRSQGQGSQECGPGTWSDSVTGSSLSSIIVESLHKHELMYIIARVQIIVTLPHSGVDWQQPQLYHCGVVT